MTIACTPKKSEEKLNKGGGGRRKNTETLEAPNSV